MSREKQIEEMIEALKKCSCVYTDCEQECSQCSNEELYDEALNHIARTFYEAGYRKQINAVWVERRCEFTDGSQMVEDYYCSNCFHEEGDNDKQFCPNCGAKMKGGEL